MAMPCQGFLVLMSDDVGQGFRYSWMPHTWQPVSRHVGRRLPCSADKYSSRRKSVETPASMTCHGSSLCRGILRYRKSAGSRPEAAMACRHTWNANDSRQASNLAPFFQAVSMTLLTLGSPRLRNPSRKAMRGSPNSIWTVSYTHLRPLRR